MRLQGHGGERVCSIGPLGIVKWNFQTRGFGGPAMQFRRRSLRPFKARLDGQVAACSATVAVFFWVKSAWRKNKGDRSWRSRRPSSSFFSAWHILSERALGVKGGPHEDLLPDGQGLRFPEEGTSPIEKGALRQMQPSI